MAGIYLQTCTPYKRTDTVTDKVVDGYSFTSQGSTPCQITPAGMGGTSFDGVVVDLLRPHVLYCPLAYKERFEETGIVVYDGRTFAIKGIGIYDVPVAPAGVEVVLEELDVLGEGTP